MSEVSLYSWIALLWKYTSFEVEFSSSIYIVLTFKGKNNVCVFFFFLPRVFTSKISMSLPQREKVFKNYL